MQWIAIAQGVTVIQPWLPEAGKGCRHEPFEIVNVDGKKVSFCNNGNRIQKALGYIEFASPEGSDETQFVALGVKTQKSGIIRFGKDWIQQATPKGSKCSTIHMWKLKDSVFQLHTLHVVLQNGVSAVYNEKGGLKEGNYEEHRWPPSIEGRQTIYGQRIYWYVDYQKELAQAVEGCDFLGLLTVARRLNAEQSVLAETP